MNGGEPPGEAAGFGEEGKGAFRLRQWRADRLARAAAARELVRAAAPGGRIAVAAWTPEFLVRTAGHVVSHREALISSGQWRVLHDDLSAFAETRGHDRAGRLDLRLDYLLAVAEPQE